MSYFELGMDKKLIVPYAEYLKAMEPDFEYIGPTSDIVKIVRSLYLPEASSVKIIGSRGAGTTAQLNALVHHQTSDFMPAEFMVRPIFRFNSNQLFSVSDTKEVESRFQRAMEELQREFRQKKVKPILIMDDGCTFVEQAPQYVINSLIEAVVNADYVDLIVAVDKKQEDEFDKKHPEFKNSFTRREVNEPTPETLLDILRHRAKKHLKEGVKMNDDILRHIIDITNRFKSMYDTAQPNRAIRLLDASATAFRIDVHSRAPGSYEKERDLRDFTLKSEAPEATAEEKERFLANIETLKIELETAAKEWEGHRIKIKTLQEEIRKFDVLINKDQLEIESLDNQTKDNAFAEFKELLAELPEGHGELKGRAKADILKLDRENLLKFFEWDLSINRNPKVKSLNANIAQYTAAIDKKHDDLREMGDKMHHPVLMPLSVIDDIATEVTKTPVGGVTGRLRENLRKGEDLMRESVFGQDHVIKPIVYSLKRAAAGLQDPNRPLGIFLIAGPPGTGKTWMAKQLAVKLFGSLEYYSELKMTDFMEKHTVSRLIGAPPGYAGYGDKGKLIEIAQQKPFGVLLLDEIEKAHPDILQSLLPVLSSGEAIGLDGEEADFRNIIVVATSNFGNNFGIWDGDYQEGVKRFYELLAGSEGKKIFSPEFQDRFDGKLCAGPLDESALTKIVTREIGALERKTRRNSPEFNLAVDSGSVVKFVMDNCLGHSGRRAEMLINQMIGDRLVDIILSGTSIEGTLEAQYKSKDDGFAFNFMKGAVDAQRKVAALKMGGP